MEQYDPRVDAYIEKAADFAKPILTHIREVVHNVSPLITETIKWGMPFFDYQGPVCMMAAFKQHCAFGFWKQSRLNDPERLIKGSDEESGAGSFGRVAAIGDLPSDEALTGFIMQVIAMNQSGIKEPKKPAAPKAAISMPAEFKDALISDAKVLANFENFSQSKQREYLEWITEAKTEATRNKRIQQAVEWIAEGKSRNWKYE